MRCPKKVGYHRHFVKSSGRGRGRSPREYEYDGERERGERERGKTYNRYTRTHTHAQSTTEKGEGEGKNKRKEEDRVIDGHTAVCSFLDPHSYAPLHSHFSLEVEVDRSAFFAVPRLIVIERETVVVHEVT